MRALHPTTHLNCSRRGFLVLAGAGLSAVGHAATAPEGITARQVIERIQKNVGVPWRAETVDTSVTSPRKRTGWKSAPGG